MLRGLRRKKSGFTLVEISVVLVILAVLGALVIPRILGRVEKAKEAEAFMNLGAIRSAELLLHSLSGKFVAAENAADIQSALGLTIDGLFYSYKIIDVTDENFLAVATPLDLLESWLQDYAIDKNGFVGYNPSSGGGSRGGSSGGGSGGSSGGSTGGGVGGSSGGSSGGTMGGSPAAVGYGATHGSVGGGTIIVPILPVVNPSMPFPTNVTGTSNNGWLHVGWDAGTTGNYGVVYRATKTNGVIGSFEPLVATLNDGWSDQVTNGTEYCYQVTSYNDTTNEESIPSSPPVCETASATSAAALAVVETKADLRESTQSITAVDGVSSGEQLGDWLAAQGVPVLYGRTSCSWVNGQQLCTGAYQDPNTDTIIINKDYVANYPKSAVLLSHETLHAIWDKDYDQYLAGVPGRPQYGLPPDPPGGVRSSNSID